ncbi:GIY-YIG nuclease family protein [Patescibacteria group bacterium]
MHYVYILKSQKTENWFYKGSAGDLKRRVAQHSSGEVDATRPHLPVELVYYEAYVSEKAARDREQSIKKSGSVWKPLMDRIKSSLDE